MSLEIRRRIIDGTLNVLSNISFSSVSGTLAQLNTAVTDADVASLAGTETLTGKTVNLTGNTLSGTTAQFNTALSDNDFATLAGTETLTTKTVNLASNTLTGTTAQFNTALSDNDFATIAGTETLTGKTLTGPKVDAVKDTNGVSVVAFGTTASAVNFLSLANAVNFGYPTLTCSGTSTNIGLQLLPKGNGYFQIFCATGQTPKIDATAPDANVDLNITTKGTGQLKSNGNPVAVEVAVPATATAAGAAGQIAYDSGFVYVCTAANTWKRAAIAAW